MSQSTSNWQFKKLKFYKLTEFEQYLRISSLTLTSFWCSLGPVWYHPTILSRAKKNITKITKFWAFFSTFNNVQKNEASVWPCPYGQLQMWVPLYYKKCTFLSVSIFYTEILTEDAIFTSPKTGQAFHIAIKAIKGLAICRANTVAPEIEPMTSRFAVKRSSNWANLVTVYYGEAVCLLRVPTFTVMQTPS